MRLINVNAGAVVLNRVSRPPQGWASPYALNNMKSLLNKFTNKYIYFYTLLDFREACNKEQLLKGGVVEKRLRINTLESLKRLKNI